MEVKFYKNLEYYEYSMGGGCPWILISDFVGCPSRIDIPSEINGCPVIEIGKFAFSGCNSLQNVVISNGVKTINYGAFTNCTSLKNIIIPDSVDFIGMKAFECCTSLKTITIPRGVQHIAGNILWGCDSFEEVKCHPNSYAEKWAIENGYKVAPIQSKLSEFLNIDDENCR